MGLKDFFKSLASSPTLLPNYFHLPNKNVLLADPSELEGQFEPQQHYFMVRVNEMFLSDKRKWFHEIEPMVVCLSSYIYGEQEIDNPFIVGRNLIESKMQNVPEGMLFYDTRVAGIHPYSGSRLVLGIALCQSVTKDYLSDSLEFIEKVSGVFSENITKLVSNYLKIANVVIGGIDKLLDSKTVEPLFGFRQEFDYDAHDHFAPGFYVMLDKSEVQWNPEKFFVKENRLFYGDSMETATSFRSNDYVLFSIIKSDTRGDIKLLPVWQSYKKILNQIDVNEVTDENKTKIKGMLNALSIEMRQSPDLTQPHAQKLMEQWKDEVRDLIIPKYNWGASSASKLKDFWDKMDDKIGEI